MTGILLIAAISVFVVYLIFTYNRFVRLGNQATESWSDIDVQLKRRYDLVPNLVETVKGYAAHEKGTFEKVTEARTQAMSTIGIQDKAQAENALTGALKSLFAVSENYPNLKANENFLDLQKNLSEIEDNIQLARRYYNAVVRDYNTLCQSFPSLIVALLFHFTAKAFFNIPHEEEQAPKAQFAS